MREYMITLFAASATLSLLSHISYPSRLENVRRFAFGIILFSVVASPFFNALSNLVNGAEGLLPPDVGAGEAGDEIFEESFRIGIRDSVCEKFELSRGDVRVLTEGFSCDGWRAEKIRIILSGKAALADYHEIERYINNMKIGECITEIEIG